MSRLLIKNARAVLGDRVTEPLNILVEDEKISKIGAENNICCEESIDAEGGYLFPGFIDVHIHGGGGADFMDGTPDAFETAAKSHLSHGTTTLVPTAMTATFDELVGFIRAYREFKEHSPFGYLAAGLHLEGPYFSTANVKSKGAQDGSLIRDIDLDEVEALLKEAKGDIIRWDAAPEVANSDKFAERLTRDGIICAVAHTFATADEAEKGYEYGFSHVTHFYNAVTAYMKREQLVTAGVVEVTYLNPDITVELICDGKHIPKQCLHLALKIKGAEKVLGITDATRLAGTAAKSGRLGSLKNGTEVIVDDGVAKLPDMISYAGSICTMDRALKVLCVDYGVEPVIAAKMLSTTPAKHIGIDNIGSVKENFTADLVLTDSSFCIKNVISRGNIVK